MPGAVEWPNFGPFDSYLGPFWRQFLDNRERGLQKGTGPKIAPPHALAKRSAGENAADISRNSLSTPKLARGGQLAAWV